MTPFLTANGIRPLECIFKYCRTGARFGPHSTLGHTHALIISPTEERGQCDILDVSDFFTSCMNAYEIIILCIYAANIVL